MKMTQYRHEDSCCRRDEMPSRTLYVVIRPYQLFCSLCYCLTKDRTDTSKRDLLIYGEFSEAKQLGQRVRDAGIFNQVTVVEPVPEARFAGKDQGDGISFVMRALLDYEGCRQDFIQATGGAFEGKGYTTFVFNSATRFTLSAKLFLAPDAYSVLIEDGTGSYNGCVAKRFTFFDQILNEKNNSFTLKERLKKTINRMVNRFTRGRFRFYPRCLHLFNPSDAVLGRYVDDLEVHRLAFPTGDAWDSIRQVFPVPSDNPYSCPSCVFLTVGNRVPHRVLEIQKKCLDVVDRCWTAPFVLREHPSSTTVTDGLAHAVPDKSGALWEMLCIDGFVSDNSILISFSSTAQITPKMLVGKEPILVFLAELLPDDFKDRRNMIETMSNAIELYENKERVLIPHSVEELSEMLKRLCSDPNSLDDERIS